MLTSKIIGGLSVTKKDTCQEFCFDSEAVEHVQKHMLNEQDIDKMAETFKILADPTRVKILHALAHKELCVCDIAVTLDMKVSAVSHQLRLLKSARLVKQRREGKNVYYQLDDHHVEQLFEKTLEHIKHQ